MFVVMKIRLRSYSIKGYLLLTATVIAILSLYISHSLVRDLSVEEKNRMQLWAQAMKMLEVADEHTDLTMVLSVLNANQTIPVIVVNQRGEIQTYRNVEITSKDTMAVLQEKCRLYKKADSFVHIDLEGEGESLDVCYAPSLMLTRLAVYPYIQLAVFLLFVLIVIFALLSAKKAEQNKLWVGLSKETAHQLGTPISSLMAWMELLKEKYPADELLPAIVDDVGRLQMIADRFSKIGSTPDLCEVDLRILLDRVLSYIAHRSSDKVKITLNVMAENTMLQLNEALFEWVIENLCKNAIDAMEGMGELTLTVSETPRRYYIDVADTGKGIDKKYFEEVFSPGYTTKKRGWGLGLSLARRIIAEYHFGRIFVKSSEPYKETVFRIELKKGAG